jgi:hypothetical protein
MVPEQNGTRTGHFPHSLYRLNETRICFERGLFGILFCFPQRVFVRNVNVPRIWFPRVRGVLLGCWFEVGPTCRGVRDVQFPAAGIYS